MGFWEHTVSHQKVPICFLQALSPSWIERVVCSFSYRRIHEHIWVSNVLALFECVICNGILSTDIGEDEAFEAKENVDDESVSDANCDVCDCTSVMENRLESSYNLICNEYDK